MAIELDAVINRYGKAAHEEVCAGIGIMEYRTGYGVLYVAHSGPGEIAASAAASILIGHYGAEMIINFGVVGGLTPDMSLAHTVVVDRVVHYDFDAHEIGWGETGKYPDLPDRFIPVSPELAAEALKIFPELRAVTCASADKFVGSPANKRELHRLYGAQICDMETAGIALTAMRAGVPCLVIKTVSDSVEGGAEEFGRELARSSAVCIDIADRIINGMHK